WPSGTTKIAGRRTATLQVARLPWQRVPRVGGGSKWKGEAPITCIFGGSRGPVPGRGSRVGQRFSRRAFAIIFAWADGCRPGGVPTAFLVQFLLQRASAVRLHF